MDGDESPQLCCHLSEWHWAGHPGVPELSPAGLGTRICPGGGSSSSHQALFGEQMPAPNCIPNPHRDKEHTTAGSKVPGSTLPVTSMAQQELVAWQT